MGKDLKVLLIGIDSLMLQIVDELIKRGQMPTMKKLMDSGCTARADGYYPLETGANWPTIATGAPPRKHECAFAVHMPGTPLTSVANGFSSKMCKAEQIWQVFDREGKLSVIFDFPQSYPVNINNVIHVGEDGKPAPSTDEIAPGRGYTTEEFEDTRLAQRFLRKIALKRAEGWDDLPESAKPPLEVELPIENLQGVLHASLFALITATKDGYDTVQLFPKKDGSQPLGTAREKQWSDWIELDFVAATGTLRAAFAFKPLKIAPDGSALKLYLSQIYPQDNYAHPKEWCEELSSLCGPYLHGRSFQGTVMCGACDEETFFEEAQQQAVWYGKAAKAILQKGDWHLFAMKYHPLDFLNHFCLHMIDPAHPLHDPKKADEAWDFVGKCYSLADDLVADILEAAGPDCAVCVVGDHGHVINCYDPPRTCLVERELTVLKPDGGIDWSRTKAVYAHTGFWVNLKYRDPNGIVEPGEEFDEVCSQIIEAALDMREPITNGHVFNLVARKEDLEFMGIGGDKCPDVVACIQPIRCGGQITAKEYRKIVAADIATGAHGAYLPSTKLSLGGMQSMLVMSGPGLKKRQRLEHSVSLSRIAPTLCALAGVPRPRDAEGCELWEFLEG